MILVVNDQPLNISVPQTPNEIWVAERIEWLQKNKKRLFFEFQINKKDDLGIRITQPGSSFYAVAYRTSPKNGLREKWMLSDQQLYSGDKKMYSPKKFKERLDIDIYVKDDPLKAFFFYYIFSKRPGEGVENSDDDVLGRLGYVLRDWDKEAEDSNEVESLEFKVGDIILNRMNESDVTLRCNALGIDTKDLSFALKKRKLFESVRTRAKSRNIKYSYQDFIDQAKKNSPELILSAYINKALKDKVIKLDGNVYKYVDTGDVICAVTASRIGDPMGFLVEYFTDDQDSKQYFLDMLGGNIEEIAQTAVDYENIANPLKLRKIAKEVYACTDDELSAQPSIFGGFFFAL